MVGSGSSLWSNPKLPLFYETLTYLNATIKIFLNIFFSRLKTSMGVWGKGGVVCDIVAGHFFFSQVKASRLQADTKVESLWSWPDNYVQLRSWAAHMRRGFKCRGRIYKHVCLHGWADTHISPSVSWDAQEAEQVHLPLRSWFSEPRVGEMTDARTLAGNIQMSLENLIMPESKEEQSRSQTNKKATLLGAYQRAQIWQKALPMSKSETM